MKSEEHTILECGLEFYTETCLRPPEKESSEILKLDIYDVLLPLMLQQEVLTFLKLHWLSNFSLPKTLKVMFIDQEEQAEPEKVEFA